MKTYFLILFSAVLFSSAQAQIFHENFEVADSVTFSSTGTGNWSQNNRLSTSGALCDSVSILSPGDYASMTTLSFSTVGHNSVFLYFNHICKIEFFDFAILEVSIDGGASWSQLTANMGSPWGSNNCYYFGAGLYQPQGSRFHEASYASWMPGTTTSPDSSWWITEVFDVSPLLLNIPDAKLRFTISDGNNSGGAGRAGWFIDDILISDSLALNLSPLKNRFTGSLYVDLNLNQIKEINEPVVPWQGVWSLTAPRITYSYSTGYYILDIYTTGNSTIQPSQFGFSSTYYTVAPATHSANFTGFQQTDSLNDFAFQPTGIYDDLSIDIFHTTPFFRPGWVGSYGLVYKNKGTTYQNSTIVLYTDSSLTLNSTSTLPSTVSSDSIIWNLTNIPPLFSGIILVNFDIDSTAGFGTLLNSHCVINPVTGDFNPSNNVDTVSNMIFGSWDPNAIAVTPEIIYTPDVILQPDINYTIYFQNTGNDTAFYVRINNIIPPELDINSYELIATSHNVALNYNPANGLMQYIFNNILLPDSTINEAASHGYIKYKIKPLATLVAGDSIKSIADIYFDYNLAVTTNTALTVIEEPLSINYEPSDRNNMKILPNPVNNELTLLFNTTQTNTVSINLFNIYGQQLKTLYHGVKNAGTHQQTADVSDLANGIYFITLKTGDKLVTAKIVKMEK